MNPAVREGEPWGEPTAPGTPVREVEGDDSTLAAALDGGRAVPGVVRFRPTAPSDLALALGISGTDESARQPMAVSIDVLDGGQYGRAVNGFIAGHAPSSSSWWHGDHHVALEVDGRPVFSGAATGIVIANGQFFAGRNTVPRGHPGDGIFEIQVYAVPRSQRRELRRRLRVGSHLPHPGIHQFRGRTMALAARRPLRVEADGIRRGRASTVEVAIVPGALRLVLSGVKGS